jgi:hypothetical protein
MKKMFLVCGLIMLSSVSSFAGDIWLYDAANKQIGILAGMNDEFIDVYVPTLERLIMITIGSETYSGIPANIGTIYGYGKTLHINSECTDSPGIAEPVEKIVSYSYLATQHYGYGKIDPATLKDYYYEKYEGGVCQRIVDYSNPSAIVSSKGAPLIEVVLPFTPPITFPISFKYVDSARGGKPIK